MTGTDRKKRTNVGCVAYSDDADFIGMLKEQWGHEVLQYNEVLGDFFPFKAAPSSQENLLKPPPTPLLETVGEVVLEVADALCDACQTFCGSIADNVCTSLDAFSESMFLSDRADKLNENNPSVPAKEAAVCINLVTSVKSNADEESVDMNPSVRERIACDKVEPKQPDSRSYGEDSMENLHLGDWDILEDAVPPHESSVHFAASHEAYVLLITSRSDPSFYILPKGGLRTKESPCCGALRECWEESGVSGYCEGKIPFDEASFQRRREFVKEKSSRIEENSTKEEISCIEENSFQEPSLSQASLDHDAVKEASGLPDRDSKGRKIKQWHWFSVPASHVSCEWPERRERERIWVPLKHLSKFKRLRADARYILDAWQAHCVRNELVL